MLNTMLEWLSPVIGWVSGLDMVAMARYTCGLLFIALACYTVMLKLTNRDIKSDLAWWENHCISIDRAREKDNEHASRTQQGLRINLIKAQDDLSQACDSFNEYMATKDARVRQLQDQLKTTKLELDLSRAAIRMSGKIYISYVSLIEYLDNHCNISIRDEKGRFSGRVTASGLYDAKFKHEIYKGDI